MKTFIRSNREFTITTSINGVNEQFDSTFCCLIEDRNNDSETIYSLQDIIDKIMDLKVKEYLFFQPNRDDDNSKGIITRII